MHLTLFNQVQVDVHVEFFYLSVNGAEDLKLVHVCISSSNLHTCTMNECFTDAIS